MRYAVKPRLLRGVLLALCVVTSGLSQAAEVTITAQYRGQSNGEFEDTTPDAPFCRWINWICKDTTTVGLPVTYVKRTIQDAPNNRDAFFLKAPARRSLEVVNANTGERHTLSFEVVAIGAETRVRAGGNTPVNIPKGGCGFLGGVTFDPWEDEDYATRATYLWSVSNPTTPQECWSSSTMGRRGDVRDSEFFDLAIGYRLFMPQAHRMGQGLYRGRLQLGIGSGAEFDLGNGVSELSDGVLGLNFELDVQHNFQVQFPPGSERAVLEPPGGWNTWLGGRGAPTRLYRDLPLRLWSTGPFKVYKHCQYNVGAQCGIRNDAGHSVPVSVALTLPPGVQEGNASVTRRVIPTGLASALTFKQVMPVDNQPGQLHFEVAAPGVQAMLPHAGRHYEGEVTVVFDADL